MVEDQFLVCKVFPLDRVQQRRLPPRNAFLSGLWSRSLTLFQVDVFMVLSQDKVHLLLTLQLVLKNVLMSLVSGFFRTFPKMKKVRSWLRARVRGCPPVSAHPRRLLSWRSRPCRTPPSGCSSGTATLARSTTGRDALERLSGSHRVASRWCGGRGLVLAFGYACQYV